MQKKLNCVIIMCFILVLVMPLIFINKKTNMISENENRRLVAFPEVFNQEGKLNSSFKSDFENWLNDNIGFREQFLKIASNIKVKIFNSSTSEKVHFGKDGWYYYTQDNNLEIAHGTYPNFDETILERICRQQLKIQEKLNGQGIEYVLILAPSKVSIYPEYIQGGDYSVIKTPDDILADYLEQHSNMKVVRLKDALLSAKKSGQLYFKTDTHWNEYGSYIGYLKIIEDLKRWGMIKESAVDVSFEVGKHRGEFSAMLGNIDLLDPEACPKSRVIEQSAQKIEEGDKYETIQKLKENENIFNPVYLYENKSITEPRVLMYGDSMFGSWNATELLAENFSEFTYVWNWNIQQEMINQVNPDIIFYEMGERYLNQLYKMSNEFTRTILTEPSAEIVFHDAPESINNIDSYTIHITVKNTGTENWSEDDSIRLCIWQDGIDHGYRLFLPDGIIVAPGEEYTFTLDGFVLPDGAQTVLEFQMLQEGITYFGEREKVNITVKG